ncbi:MAG: deoxyribodipyrimidine photolyase [Deltaproteobacteria bacterium]|nr:deoxyribodipyrimidine photolyase [Deltaproteobacteria bacterium]
MTLDPLCDHPATHAHLARLAALNPAPPAPARWLYAPYDQLSLALAPLDEGPAEWGLLLIESGALERQLPFHKQRVGALALNQRAFACEAAAAGYAVRYVITEGDVASALGALLDELDDLGALGALRGGAAWAREPAERRLRVALAPLLAAGRLRPLPHPGWLTTPEDFERAVGAAPPWRMDAFYRAQRRRTGLLMEGGRPEGGRWSLDADNRRPWRGDPPAPDAPRFEGDDPLDPPWLAPLRAEVTAWVEDSYADHPGALDLAAVPAAASEHERLWAWALARCLPEFGPYEDAISAEHSGLFHTRVSLSVNLHRLLPARVVRDAAACGAPLASREGFVRQVLGWREFVRHVHLRTDGHRRGLEGSAAVAAAQGDGGYEGWRGAPWRPRGLGGAPLPPAPPPPDGGALPLHLAADPTPARLPPAFWGAPSGLRCLDVVVAGVWREGWSHHITRLMVLCNWGGLLGLSPRALADWFYAAYIDAFDWVVEPNVLGMGLFATGPVMSTKPYTSGSAYLERMSDLCEGCAARAACPMTAAYWDHLARNEEALRANPRLSLPLASMRARSPARKAADRADTERARALLLAGERVAGEGRDA